MRIGLFGGTFNPIHKGHLAAAAEVKEKFPLDRVDFIPSSLPPHKESPCIASSRDRIEMIRPLVAEYDEFNLSKTELERTGPSYTIDTLIQYEASKPADAELYLMIGIDAFLEIDTWKSYADLFDMIPFIVMTRPGSGFENKTEAGKQLETFIQTRVSGAYSFSASDSCYTNPEKHTIFLLEITPIHISSTMIRRLIKSGQSIASLVPKQVEAYIKNRGLYK